MRCEEVSQQFTDYVNNSLAPEALRAFEAHLARCSSCREETADLQHLWIQLGDVRLRAMNSDAMDTRFDAMITAFKQGADPAAAAPGQAAWARFQSWLGPFGQRPLAAAMALALILIGTGLLMSRDWSTKPENSGKPGTIAAGPGQTLTNPPDGTPRVTTGNGSQTAQGSHGPAGAAAGATAAGSEDPTRGAPLHARGTANGGAALFQTIAARDRVADFGGSERYLTHVTTDKPIYRGGEKLYVRAVVLLADGHAPAMTGTAFVEIKGPKGDTLASSVPPIADGTAAFVWDIPVNQAGGQYTARISYPGSGDAPAERKFDIRTYRAPRLKTQIVFVRDGYGPGDTVAANLHVDRAEGGIPAGAKVSMVARVDGEEAWKGTTTVDAAGNAGARFKLPAAMARGEGVLAMTIEDGGTVETAAKTIPILLQTLDLAIYPEGGDLIAGLPNRVYVEGRTPAQKPADMAGLVVNAAGKTVGAFRTEHQGRGRFTFTPVAGESYSLRITEPAGIKTLFPLPAAQTSGVVLASTADVTVRQNNVVVRVAATSGGAYGVTLSQRGKEIAFTAVTLAAYRPLDVTFAVPRALDGVLTATVYDGRMMPMAERLLFRQPDRKIKVQVTADKKSFIPGDKVTLRVTATDETGKPAGAVVGLTVTDSSVLEMIDKREQAPQLPVMVLLENDVRNLADAHVYLDESNPKAPLATDLLLGTQGWRRFATVDPLRFVAANGDAARRALGLRPALPAAPAFVQTAGRQSTGGTTLGKLTGVITDVSGARLPGVSVKVRNEDTGTTLSALTNEQGDFSILVQPATNYTLTTLLTGFKQTVVKNIPARVGNETRMDVKMEVGAADTQLMVSADRRQNLRKATQAAEIILDEELLQGLPMVGNDPITLITTMPGFRANPLGHEFDTIGGLPMAMLNTVRDGLSVTDGFNPGGVGANTIMNPDMISELRMVLNPVDSELGRQIDPTLKSISPSTGSRGTSVPVTLTGSNFLPGLNVNNGGFSMNAANVVREYAHNLRPGWTEGSRTDFAETVYWNAALKTDAGTGLATVSFNLSDAVTSFRVLADAFTLDGTLGSSVSSIEAVRPFYVEPKIPLQVTSGDVIQLPIGIVNGTGRDLGKVEVLLKSAEGIRLNAPGDALDTLSARTRRILPIDIDRNFSGVVDLRVDASAGPYRDTVARKLDVQPLGFPYELSNGGMLTVNGAQSFEFTLPEEMVRGSATSSVIAYPTPLASMTQALQSLLRQPYGCFEQTSSTSYPMTMAQQYFMTHSGVEPAIIEKAKDLLELSYKRLTGFESRNGGYEWFGGDIGHEALTAYGLLQFTDMAQVREVDSAMLKRTRDWLFGRRDDKGGFNRDSRSHGEGIGSAPPDTTNAYITWALLESGEKGLEKQIAAVKASANSSEDSYLIALAANILHASGDRAGARPLMERLVKAQGAAGNVKGAANSITRSGGEALMIEATALSVLAWMREPLFKANSERGVQWIVESNKNGRFGSTQSTILALRAIVTSEAARARTRAPGRIFLTLDGKTVGAPIAFTADNQGAIVIPAIASELGPGKHTIALKMEDGFDMPFSIALNYSSLRPDSSDQARIGIQVALKNRQLQEGGITEATVAIVNKSDEPIPTPVAIVGIPGGLEIRHDQLKELVKSGKIAAYELIGREVILYWRSIKAKDKFELPLSLVAAVPGSYTGPASRAYLYYTDEFKTWAPGLTVNITPR